jgi:8-oxo-dGTP pyrophosphatase MutT (NUDIX family)
MPVELTARARTLVTGEGEWTAPPARDAATVILLRDGVAGLEVFLQRRIDRMTFAPGMYVFPGGRVEESDAVAPWSGPIADPFPVSPDAGVTATFRALTCAGARETWEEAGTVLAAGDHGPVQHAPSDPATDFVGWLETEGYRVDGDMMRPWSHWVTPEVERKRFDTRFLVALLPAGQRAVDRGVESDHSSWFSPAAALAGTRDRTMPMLPPTAHALTELCAHESAADAFAAARDRHPRPLLPRPFLTESGDIAWRMVDAYTGEQIALS